MKTIVFCYTIPGTFNFSIKTIKSLKDLGHNVVLISSDKEKLTHLAKSLGVQSRHLEMSRSITIWRDLKLIIQLISTLRKCNPDIVIGATPKAALISMVASYFSKVNYRIYHIFGLPYETARGFKRFLLKTIELITSLFSSEIIPISHSIYQEYQENFPFVKNKINYFYPLTVGGVDIERFNPANFRDKKLSLREELSIAKQEIVIGFVARLTIDKGVYDFIEVFENLSQQYSNLTALVVGSKDTRDSAEVKRLEEFFNWSNVIHIEWTTKVEKYFSIMDIFVLPSYREGFGNVNVEASAMEIPVVSYDVTGCKDSVLDKVTGILVKSHDRKALFEAILFLVGDIQERKLLGKQGRKHVSKTYSDDIVAKKFADHILK